MAAGAGSAAVGGATNGANITDTYCSQGVETGVNGVWNQGVAVVNTTAGDVNGTVFWVGGSYKCSMIGIELLPY
jgi:hypothetical protein